MLTVQDCSIALNYLLFIKVREEIYNKNIFYLKNYDLMLKAIVYQLLKKREKRGFIIKHK